MLEVGDRSQRQQVDTAAPAWHGACLDACTGTPTMAAAHDKELLQPTGATAKHRSWPS